MKRLWAPWRKAYIRPKNRKDSRCLFCRIRDEKKDPKNYLLKRNSTAYAVLNIYPYTNGHVLIVPNRHVASMAQLKAQEKLDWLALADESLAGLKKAIRPQGFNVGINLGRIAGAGVPGHLHLHIVPRWQGDTNFMPVLGETRVISESLDSLYAGMTAFLKKNKKSGNRRSRT